MRNDDNVNFRVIVQYLRKVKSNGYFAITEFYLFKIAFLEMEVDRSNAIPRFDERSDC